LRSVLFRFESPGELLSALDGDERVLPLPEGRAHADGEWVLCLFELGKRRRSTASAARIRDLEGHQVAAFESRDWERLRAFAQARAEAVPTSRRDSSPDVSEADGPIELTISGRFRVSEPRHVVVLDPHEAVYAALTTTLGPAHVSVAHTNDSAKAVEDVERGRVHLLVLADEGNATLDLIKQLRQGGHRVPILFVSDSPGSKPKVSAFAAGADDFIARPLRPTELGARVLSLLSSTGAK
jgi:two-component system phosphate regulon response regulator PhoB